MEGGDAEVQDVMMGPDNPPQAGWNESARAELLQLAGAGMPAVDGDRVTLRLNDDGWRRLAMTLAAVDQGRSAIADHSRNEVPRCLR
jgi:hypothetical protein